MTGSYAGVFSMSGSWFFRSHLGSHLFHVLRVEGCAMAVWLHSSSWLVMHVHGYLVALMELASHACVVDFRC